ncbi:MAG: hypothetical protein COZ21_07790 [Bacteroidetes bacterium CG_4_10_14_3_um_filter_31_20]|nr:MAG: hypothetical protein COZ59_02810 [Bacteroidetes bacterium CG_4_8_14_3_um_filter_31_14]PIY03986.1 MAG: hypothetical protein COZ21_07790 [Bacteroidetes bacterium CG_4_10_14_3_um_filter_31_20]
MKIGLIIIMVLFGRPNIIMKQSEWTKTINGNIVLYTRPYKYSNSPSPDSIAIKNLFNEANYCIDEVNNNLKTTFSKKVKIFMFNYDEAENVIGTNSGGYTLWRAIYYTYSTKPLRDLKRQRNFQIGPHEFVHIVADYCLGNGKTNLFQEGYANAIDGTYGGNDTIVDNTFIANVIENQINSKNILTPSQMLYDSKTIDDNIFYPQSGIFIKWLIKTYQIEKTNKLYTVKSKHFEREFKKITGDSFSDMEKKYLAYCDSVFKK